METYGRQRQSIADIEEQLSDIIEQHPHSHLDNEGQAVIPGAFLLDIFESFSAANNGFELTTPEELVSLKDFISQHPELEVSPQICIQFVAQKTRHSPDNDQADRGRPEDRNEQYSQRSDSADSNDTSYPRSRQSSREPQTPAKASPFDTSRRQRSTPLGGAPSSWTTKRPLPHRRKSDAGSKSDSESFSASPSAFNGRAPGRSRAPSNPTSPSTTHETLSPISSPPLSSGSRPHSRAQSQPQSHFSDFNRPFSPNDDSDDENETAVYNNYRNNRHTEDNESFRQSISSLPMPHSADSDSDGEDSALGLVMDRSTVSSTASMEPLERLDALQRTNADLARKLVEAERTLQNKLSQHESELEDMQGRLDEMRSELSASKREEKELRSKERQNLIQTGALETEIAKITKALEHARSTYTSLQRQYQEQCAASEKYRDDLRQREETIRNLREAASLHEIENLKWMKEHEGYEERIIALENELSIADQAHAQLDEQKQENLLLKETIDRMRFDMDEMRSNAASVAMGRSSGSSSKVNTISKSLGAELRGQLSSWGDDADEDDATPEDDDTESEDVIQTIITRKRKVGNRTNKLETTTFEETKEYSNVGCQHDPELSTSTVVTQTDPEPVIWKTSFSVQTDDEPTVESFAIQTEPEPEPMVRVMVEMDIQTDTMEETAEPSRSPSPAASTSSTVVPPTPRAKSPEGAFHADQPPTYNQVIERSQEQRIIAEALKQYHPGSHSPFEPVPGGIPPEIAEDWDAIKKALGTGCVVIDKIVSSSDKVPDMKNLKGRGRFYNIYNTYVYGNKDKTPRESGSILPSGPQLAICVGVIVLSWVGPYILLPTNVPDGANSLDRMAWYSYNSMHPAGEGFAGDGTAAALNILGRVGTGAARIARGFT